MAGHKPFSEIRRKRDDPLQPLTNEFTSWQDFVDRVARPLVEAMEAGDDIWEILALYRQASPYFICVSMVMMDNRLKDAE